MSAKEKKSTHAAIARHYLRGYRISRSRILGEAEFSWKLRACKHLQEAKERKLVKRIMRELSPTVKMRGHYETFIALAGQELLESNRNPDPWVAYDYAHCCLITGRLRQALNVIEPLYYRGTSHDPQRHLHVIRLYAEVLASLGQPQLALDRLREGLAALASKPVGRTALSHSQSTEIMLLTKLGRYADAIRLADALIKSNERQKNKRGLAIALTRLGILHSLTHRNEDAYRALKAAVDHFREIGDERGYSWSAFHLGLCQAAVGNGKEAVASVQESLRVRSQIGDCSPDYLQLLEIAKALFQGEPITVQIASEESRVAGVLTEFNKSL